MRNINKRLNKLAAILNAENFRENNAKGGELGFYIFDYDPEHECIVNEFVCDFIRKNDYQGAEIRPIVFDLYQLLLDILKKEAILDQIERVEKEEGEERLTEALAPLLTPGMFIDCMEKRIQPEHNLVFIIGVGNAYPLVRSHNVLNNLHHTIDKLPLIMFFPGTYDQKELRLFNKIKDDNYYRGFKIVEDIIKEEIYED